MDKFMSLVCRYQFCMAEAISQNGMEWSSGKHRTAVISTNCIPLDTTQQALYAGTHITEKGTGLGESPADTVRQCDITISCLADPTALEEVCTL